MQRKARRQPRRNASCRKTMWKLSYDPYHNELISFWEDYVYLFNRTKKNTSSVKCIKSTRSTFCTKST